jgi:hypothetical protein
MITVRTAPLRASTRDYGRTVSPAVCFRRSANQIRGEAGQRGDALSANIHHMWQKSPLATGFDFFFGHKVGNAPSTWLPSDMVGTTALRPHVRH